VFRRSNGTWVEPIQNFQVKDVDLPALANLAAPVGWRVLPTEVSCSESPSC
jgi:hypothetical protein